MPMYGIGGEPSEKAVGKVNSDGLWSQFWPGNADGAVLSGGKNAMNGSQPMFNIPTSIVVAALVLAVLHALRVALPPQAGHTMLLALAFIPARYAGPTPELPGGEWSYVASFITYMFVHGDVTHLAINMIWMLAFGSAVAKRIGDLRFVIFSLLCGIAGAPAVTIIVHLH